MLYDPLLTPAQNISKAVTGDCELDLGGVKRWIKEAQTITFHEGLKVFNGTFAGAAVLDFQVLGSHVQLHDLGLDVAGYGKSINAILELIEADYLDIRNLIITGNTPRKSILCRSTMSNVVMDGVTIKGNQGWGIVLNDSITERGRDYRKVNDKDYAGMPIGSNITIKNVDYGSELVDRPGDGTEINTPDCGSSNILVDGLMVHRAFTSGGSDGLGGGFANVTNLIVRNATIRNAKKFALHLEKGSNHLIENFLVEDSARAISLSHTTNTTYRNGICRNSEDMLISYNRLTETDGHSAGTNVLFDTVTFDGCTGAGLWIANSDGYRFKDVTIKNYAGSEQQAIVKLYQQRDDNHGANNNMFESITFDKGTSTVTPKAVIEVEQGVGNRFGNIEVIGYDNKVLVHGNELYV